MSVDDANPGYYTASVVALDGEAPSIDVPILGATGHNTVIFDPNGQNYGWVSMTTGELVIIYSGFITNDLFTEDNPLPFMTRATGMWDAATNTVELHLGSSIDLGLPSQSPPSLGVRTDLVHEVPIGTSPNITMNSPFTPNASYVVAFSGGTFPGIDLADGRNYPMNPDAIFNLSLMPSNGIFVGNMGAFDNDGNAAMTLVVPNRPAFVGMKFCALPTVLDASAPSGILRWGDPVTYEIVAPGPVIVTPTPSGATATPQGQ